MIPVRLQRFFYRLQWGFLTQHLTEASAATRKYFVHGARITQQADHLRIILELSSVAAAFARSEGGPAVVRVVLIADDFRSFSRWVTCLYRARSRRIEEWYTLRETIGEGVDGVVILGRNADEERVAVKKVVLTGHTGESVGVRLGRVLREIQLQHKASRRSESVVEIIDVFYDEIHCFIVMPFANMGTLADWMSDRGCAVDEDLCRDFAIQLGRGLLALHESGIVHRDIKCDNVLLHRGLDSDPIRLFLGDFGFAQAWRPESGGSMAQFCQTVVGTLSYLAPEIRQRKPHGAPADVFSLGVLFHVCLTGQFPFEEQNIDATGRRAERGGLDILESSDVSREAQSFCKGLLNENPRKRFTAVGLLQHRWLRRGLDVTATPRRQGTDVTLRIVFRRVFYAVMAVVTLRRWATDARQGTRLRLREDLVSRIRRTRAPEIRDDS